MREAARRGVGIAVLARYLAAEDLRSGKLVPLLEEYPIATHWLKLLVPWIKMSRPVAREFVSFLETRLNDGSRMAPREEAARAIRSWTASPWVSRAAC